jgi:hypothetical protein
VESSPFTPYHDAVAASEIQGFLNKIFGISIKVISSKEIINLEAIASCNLILVGGPNFNAVTALFMHRVREKYHQRAFQWSSEFQKNPAIQAILLRKEDHLIRVREDPAVLEEDCFDVRSPSESVPIIARGLCCRAEDILRPGRCVLVVGGVDTAFGTLAGARLLMDPKFLKKVEIESVVQIVVSACVHGYELGQITLDKNLSIGRGND